MGISLNPFKSPSNKGSKFGVPEDDLAPTKSTSSIANSIRTVQNKLEHLTDGGQGPPDATQGFDLDKDGKKPLPTLNKDAAIGNPNMVYSMGTR